MFCAAQKGQAFFLVPIFPDIFLTNLGTSPAKNICRKNLPIRASVIGSSTKSKKLKILGYGE